MNEHPQHAKPTWLGWLKLVVQLTVLVLVVWGIRRTVLGATDEFERVGFGLLQLNPAWVMLAGVAYGFGLMPACVFWKRTMESMGQAPGWTEVLSAFFVGHLGKYVPGKALVIILRTSWVVGPRVDATVAATGVFIETLTAMAVGASVSAMILALWFPNPVFVSIAIGLAILAGGPTLPPFFRRIIRWLQLKRANPEIEQAVTGLTLPLIAFGWLTMTVGWLFFGVSIWATVNALPNISAPVSDLPLLTASIALATVAGFLSLLPAGVFVREFIVISLLGANYGEANAIVAAAVLRLIWMSVEIVMAASCSGYRRLTRPS